MRQSTTTLLQTARALGVRTLTSAAFYPFRKALAEVLWASGGRHRSPLKRERALLRSLRKPLWCPFQGIQEVNRGARGSVVFSGNGEIEVQFLAPDLVAVEYRMHPASLAKPAPTYAVSRPAEEWTEVPIAVTQLAQGFLVQSDRMVVGVDRQDARLFIATHDGTLLRVDIEVARTRGGAIRHRTALAPGEKLYGLGERATPWNRRGRIHRLWNRDPAGYQADDDPLYLNVPAYVGVLDSGGAASETYLVFYDNACGAEFDLGATTSGVAEHRFAGGMLRYYVALGPVPQLLERYTELTGRHPLQPLWMLGYHQSRWSYDSAARVRKLARDLDDHHIPCDAIHLDIDVLDGFRSLTWDRKRFPDLAALATELRQGGRQLISIIDPGIKRDLDYPVYRDGLEGAHFCTLPNGRAFHAPVWPGNCAFPDFTAARTRAWWGDQLSPLLRAGIAGLWNDMNEPAAFAAFGDPTLPTTIRHAMEGVGGDHQTGHNVYGTMMARATREGLLRERPASRPVVISRAGSAGLQRYATSWTGDNESTWESLALTIPMVLGLGLSGIGFTGPDVGGFSGVPDGELFVRWVQMAAFMPFFRAHTAKGTPDQEPWSYGEPYLSIIRRFIELRYELLPYLYTAHWQTCTHGWPMVRPLSWADPASSLLWDVDDAFLCGDAFLIAPILAKGAVSRSVELPRGTWYDYWTNKVLPGGAPVTLYSPLEALGILVRAGSVVPMGEIGPSTGRRVEKFLRLALYAPPVPTTDEPNAVVSELYEDAGDGFDYQDGDCRLSRFTVSQEEGRLEVSWHREGAYTPGYEHVELTIHGLVREPRAILADGDRFAIARIDGVRHSVVLGVPIFTNLRIDL